MTGALHPQAIEKILDANITGRLGYSDGERIYVIPISYLLYNGKYIIAHSREGEKIDILRKHPKLCMEVDEIDDLDNWRSVLVWGTYQEITHPREKYYALDLLIRKINRHKMNAVGPVPETTDIDDAMPLPERKKTIVYRIEIQKQSGRFETTQTG